MDKGSDICGSKSIEKSILMASSVNGALFCHFTSFYVLSHSGFLSMGCFSLDRSELSVTRR